MYFQLKSTFCSWAFCTRLCAFCRHYQPAINLRCCSTLSLVSTSWSSSSSCVNASIPSSVHRPHLESCHKSPVLSLRGRVGVLYSYLLATLLLPLVFLTPSPSFIKVPLSDNGKLVSWLDVKWKAKRVYLLRFLGKTQTGPNSMITKTNGDLGCDSW